MSSTVTSWLQHRAERARLMHQMLERLGCAQPDADGAALNRLMPEAIAHCLCCQDADLCTQWLNRTRQPDDNAHRSFCPNATRFETLSGEKK